jgi:hypothetical protein
MINTFLSSGILCVLVGLWLMVISVAHSGKIVLPRAFGYYPVSKGRMLFMGMMGCLSFLFAYQAFMQ